MLLPHTCSDVVFWASAVAVTLAPVSVPAAAAAAAAATGAEKVPRVEKTR